MSPLPTFDFALSTVVAPGPSGPAPSPEAAPCRSELLRLAGDAAEAVNRHCEGCPTCRPEAFVGEVVAFPTCREGRELRRRYREARARALGVTR